MEPQCCLFYLLKSKRNFIQTTENKTGGILSPPALPQLEISYLFAIRRALILSPMNCISSTMMMITTTAATMYAGLNR